MRKVILYSAVSLDNFIATEDGGVEWLEDPAFPHGDNDYGYNEFYNSIDTTIMGGKTYDQITGFGVPFPYPDKKNYVVVTNDRKKVHESIDFISIDPVKTVTELIKGAGSDVWLVGGGKLNTLFFENDLIDEMILTAMPVMLGNGISLVNGHDIKTRFRMKENRTFDNGVVNLHYEKLKL